ncbi:MAG: DUF2332 family protein [Pseudomonadota bacterium]
MTVRDAFARQGPVCEALGSPFMGRLMPLIGAWLQRGTSVADRILDWPGDTSAAGDSVPLRLAGALHALKIEGIALGEEYPPYEVTDDALWAAVETALKQHETRIHRWLDSPPQTNEVRRAAALLPALALIAKAFGKPVELLELGTSAGLNLRCDQFRLHVPGGGIGPETSPVVLSPDWSGTPPSGPLPQVVARRGVDLNPLDPQKPADRLRLMAYLWPDQPERLARTQAAMELAGQVPAEITAGDAGEWTETALATSAPDRVRVLFHTIAWQYFPDATKARARAAMERSASPLVRVGMEADGGKGAAITMTTWPGGESRHLGRASFHGIWVDWVA